MTIRVATARPRRAGGGPRPAASRSRSLARPLDHRSSRSWSREGRGHGRAWRAGARRGGPACDPPGESGNSGTKCPVIGVNASCGSQKKRRKLGSGAPRRGPRRSPRARPGRAQVPQEAIHLRPLVPRLVEAAIDKRLHTHPQRAEREGDGERRGRRRNRRAAADRDAQPEASPRRTSAASDAVSADLDQRPVDQAIDLVEPERITAIPIAAGIAISATIRAADRGRSLCAGDRRSRASRL